MNYYFQILLYNSSDKLPRLLQSFNASTKSKGSTVTLFLRDQSGRKSELELVRKIIDENSSPDVRVILSSGENLGFGRGHNAIFEEFTADTNSHFFILNPDGMIFDDFFIEFDKAYSYFEQEAEQGKKWGMLEVTQFPSEHPKDFMIDTLKTVWVSGAAVYVNREMFGQVGGFDDNIFMYGEDVDLSMRSRIAGFELYHLPTVRFIHISYGLDRNKDNSFINKYIPASELYLRHKYVGEESVARFKMLLNGNPLINEIIKLYEEMSKDLTNEFQGRIELLPYQDTYAKHRW